MAEPRFKVERIRSEKHLAWIRGLRCSIPGCVRRPVDAHHLKCGPEGGGSVVASDCWAVPLCHFGHHVSGAVDGVHKTGDESGWWARHRIDPIRLAEWLWQRGPVHNKLAGKRKDTE